MHVCSWCTTTATKTKDELGSKWWNATSQQQTSERNRSEVYSCSTSASCKCCNQIKTSNCSFHIGDTEFFTVLVFHCFAPTKTSQQLSWSHQTENEKINNLITQQPIKIIHVHDIQCPCYKMSNTHSQTLTIPSKLCRLICHTWIILHFRTPSSDSAVRTIWKHLINTCSADTMKTLQNTNFTLPLYICNSVHALLLYWHSLKVLFMLKDWQVVIWLTCTNHCIVSTQPVKISYLFPSVQLISVNVLSFSPLLQFGMNYPPLSESQTHWIPLNAV